MNLKYQPMLDTCILNNVYKNVSRLKSKKRVFPHKVSRHIKNTENKFLRELAKN